MKKVFTLLFVSFQVMVLCAQESTEVFTIVEEMPVYPGCENMKLRSEKSTCTQQKLVEFIIENTENPDLPKHKKYNGTVYVSFLINEEGLVENVHVLRGFQGEYGELFDEAAQDVIKKFPKMQAGKQRGKPVVVQYTMPVRFTNK